MHRWWKVNNYVYMCVCVFFVLFCYNTIVYMFKLSKLQMLPARLTALVFMMKFDEMINDIKPVCVLNETFLFKFITYLQMLSCVSSACDEICKSIGFACFLEHVLL